MRRKKSLLPLECDGLMLQYSPANIAYVLSWKNVFLRIIEDRTEAIAEFTRLTTETEKENLQFKIGGSI